MLLFYKYFLYINIKFSFDLSLFDKLYKIFQSFNIIKVYFKFYIF